MAMKRFFLVSSTLPATRAAWMGPLAVGSDRRAVHAHPRPSVPWETDRSSSGSSLQAVCDRRSRTCHLSAVNGRNRAPTMQQVECEAKPEADEMAPQYAPAEVEQRLYEWWEKSGYFQPAEDDTKECFVISMPPPNVTGRLHMGHAMFVALEDIMARFHRMRGNPTLWLPGTDHAGIATQMLVERSLRAEGIERKEIGRDAFLDRVWEWKGEYGGYITGQIRRLYATASRALPLAQSLSPSLSTR